MATATDQHLAFTNFVDSTLNTPYLNFEFQKILEEKRLQIIPLYSYESIIYDFTHLKEKDSEKLIRYLEKGIDVYRQTYKLTKGYAPLDKEIQIQIPTLIKDFHSGIPIQPPNVSAAPLPIVPNFGCRNKNNRDKGIKKFINLCVESKNIISSVDMYSSYLKWSYDHGFDVCSSPTLTKYFRDSDKHFTESLSEKGRSQGWYLITPQMSDNK